MTRLHPDAAYWDRGVRNVPDMTGAARLLDARDLVDVCTRLGLALPLASVIDIGCGTGRLAQICTRYLGYDICPSAVDYCQGAGLDARLMTGLADVTATADLVACVSVFTHIGPRERMDYLRAFTAMAPALLVDIIPGDGSGDTARWTASPEGFEADLRAARWEMVGAADSRWESVPHRFYLCRRRGPDAA